MLIHKEITMEFVEKTLKGELKEEWNNCNLKQKEKFVLDFNFNYHTLPLFQHIALKKLELKVDSIFFNTDCKYKEKKIITSEDRSVTCPLCQYNFSITEQKTVTQKTCNDLGPFGVQFGVKQ